MIRAIVAIDDKRGMATDDGIPWKLPADERYYLDTIKHSPVLMGYGTYLAVTRPQTDRPNYVATSSVEPLRPGFIAVDDARAFLSAVREDIWHIGGAGLLATTFDLIDELYITRIKGDFNCTKFLPEYQDDFERVSASEPMEHNGIAFWYEIWQRKATKNLSKQR